MKIFPELKYTLGDPDLFKAELIISNPLSVNEFYKDATFDFKNNTFIAEAIKPNCF